MSLILEALKKLDREKQAGDRGFLVMASAAWPSRRKTPSRAALLALVAVAGAALGLWATRLRPPANAPASSPAGAGRAGPRAGQAQPAITFRAADSSSASTLTGPHPNRPQPSEAVAPPRPPTLSLPTLGEGNAAPKSAPRPIAPPRSHLTDPHPKPIAEPAHTIPPEAASPAPDEGASPHVSEASPPSPAPGSPPLESTPAVSPRSSLEAFQLQAISQRDGQPVAILNGRLVREGDSFDGIRIVRIGEAEVEIEVQGQRQVVRF